MQTVVSLAPAAQGEPILAPVLTPGAFLPGLGLALAIGLLIGIERGWRLRDEEAGARVAGVRTFALIGLLGGLIGIELPGALHSLALLLGGAALAALLLGYAADMRRDHNVSATSTVAAVLALALGAIATSGHMALASVGAGAAVILLASRDALHRAIQLTSEGDIKALLRLVLVVFVVLPLLPDRGMGPFGALNPQRLWLVVVITGSISFIGYVLARWLGTRGALLTATIGSLVSSTAVTVDSARRLREGGGLTDHAAVAIGSASMLARSLFLVSVLAPFAFATVTQMVVPALLVSIAAAAALLVISRKQPSTVELRDPQPPGLGLAFIFALTVAVLSVASAWAENRWGGGSGAILIALGGVADIDAAIAAVGALPPGTLPERSVALALAAPMLFNTLFKLALFVGIAGPRRALSGTLALGAAALALLVPLALALI